ncbi:hypothetical protein EDD37DRAFT_632258 [Exophiala viscosa]|uniref:Uncharacterized protein n=1 Tax=Exophiala viscosa TaxID=2486360 RepID=A0AAN6IDC0_9EURO|nr:hypothetical protein EDD36DRAFT_441453 [Exophiala viscosa]KAI1623719.1 hypothetical protein EDD37DRAFT_632258 [Exophiala viscosa]
MAHSVAATTPTREQQPLETAIPFLPSSSPTNSIASSIRGRDDQGGSTLKRYTFTPQRVKSLPRAWERRPATPYVPRNDAQKIWKRVPLGEVTIHHDDTWRKGNTTLNARPVKRLRVSQFDEDEDKENSNYVPSKWEDATSAVSPKRKVSGFTVVNDGLDSGEDCGQSNEYADRTSEDEDPAPSPLGRSAGDPETTDGILGPEHDLEDEGSEECASPIVSDYLSQSEDCHIHPESTETLSSTNIVSNASIAASDAFTKTTLQSTISHIGQDTVTEPNESATDQAHDQPVTLANEDDTAYLHDFLSRARAQKAARQQAPTQNLASSNEEMQTAEVMSEGRAISHVEDANNNALMTSFDEDLTSLQPDTEPVADMSSPRRSSRLVTRLPRPQKPVTSLPNTISLKRLNGTEFIAMQKEVQSLAIATRTNTKRNKGDSVAVSIKLMQLHAEANAKALEPEVKSPELKKRKKRSKQVNWDATIARYQDGSPPEEDMPEQDDQDEPRAAAEGAVEDSSQEPARQSQVVGSEEKLQVVRKVRRLRKLNAGTVNGTPAPKRTLRMSLVGSLPTGPTTDETDSNSLQEQNQTSAENCRPDSARLFVGTSEKRIQTRTRARLGQA